MMGKLICFIFSVLMNFCYLTKICEKTDIKQFFSTCSQNKREDKNCINSNNIPVPSKVSNVPCDFRCEKDLKRIQCNECPMNTFSTGGAFLVNGALKDWNDNVLKNFENHCFAYTQYANKEKNKDCSAWNLNQESTFIHSGNSYLDDVIYASQLAFGIYLQRDGYVEFKYKKDAIGEGYWANGLFTFYLDYDLVVDDSTNNMVWQVASFNLTRGYHNFLWSYVTYVEGTNQATKNLKAFIDYIKIDGVEYADISCSKCVNKFSEPGSDSCIFCNYNNYFNEEAQSCIKCPSNTYSFPNSIGAESCKTRHQCTENDYSANFTKCESGKRNITFHWDEPLLCNNLSSKLPDNYQENCSLCSEGMFLKLPEKECRICEQGFYSNNETFKFSLESCQECPIGKYPVRVFNIERFENMNNYFDNHCSSVKSENCLNNRGFKAKLDKVISGNYLPSTLELNLVLNFEIIYDQGEISYNFNLSNFQQNETFLVKINGIVQETFNKDGKYEKNYILKKGKYQIIWAYQRNNSLNNNNTVEIYRFFVKGSNLGGAISCTNCFEGSIRSKSGKFCENCLLGFTSNPEGSECISCPENTYNDGFTGGKCIKCPAFTVPNKEKNGCVLLDILHNERFLLKISTVNVKEQIDNLCNKDLEICYGSFMGPIKKADSDGLFFISPFDSDSINITDFTYVRPDDANSLGYVFGLFPTNRINKNTQTLTVENTKVLESLGRKISVVKQFFYQNNSDICRDGFYIKYKEGSTCKANPSKNYQTYVFFVCDKSRDIRAPRLLYLLEDCTYVFEWRGRGGCPQCLKPYSKIIKSACYQNTRSVFFQEESNCIIFPSNNSLSGYNSSVDDESNIVEDLTKEDFAVSYYFKENHKKETLTNKGYVSPVARNISLILRLNLTKLINKSVLYLNDWREEESCTLIDDLDNYLLIIIIVVPVLYFLFILLLIYFCCKYKKAKHNYQKLKDESEGKDTINTQPDNNKIEAD